jgi:hypothetical protein
MLTRKRAASKYLSAHPDNKLIIEQFKITHLRIIRLYKSPLNVINITILESLPELFFTPDS